MLGLGFLALATSAAGCGGSDETVGQITRVADKTVFIGTTEGKEGDAFPANTRLRTDRFGSIEFELDSGTGCHTQPNSELAIEPPGRRVSIDFRAGRSTCVKDPSAGTQTYLAGKTLVTADDPVFGVTVNRGETVVQVTFGFVEVKTPAAEPIVVGPDQQAVVPSGQPTPRLEEIDLGPGDKRIADAFEDRLPTAKAEPPSDVEELVVGMDPSVPDLVKSFVRRLLATTWNVDVRVEVLLEENLETKLRAGAVDIVAARKSALPTGAAVSLFTRNGMTWVLASLADSSFAQALRKLLTVSLETGAYGELYAEVFAAQPTYTHALGNDMTVLASEVEHVVPTTTITRNPPSNTASTAARFEFESSKSNVEFSCQLDSSDPEPCESPEIYATIEAGRHTFTVRTTDAAGSVGRPATYTWIVTSDGGGVTGPTTKIISGPESETTRTDASFTFRASDEAAEYGCSLDRMPFRPCVSPESYPNLLVGDHVFAVRAVEANENVGPVARRSWTIIEGSQAGGPTTRIVAKPQRRTRRSFAVFRFRSDPGAPFQCSLDGTGFDQCTSPQPYRNLGPGRHTFAVRARAPNGRAGPPATYSWSILGSADRQRPVTTILSAPAAQTSERHATFSFRANESNVRFSCSLDGGEFESCSSPWPLEGLQVNAEHTFAVRATDAAGNIGEPARYSWEIVFG